ncbi:NYN domain-containing protein [Fodinicola feengrottensis]|uniref:NYN domain-containing protein n=1 Tax=Fodinicola feengrottensis TaxID=435914 RepID=UPI0031CEB4BC
MAVFIDLENLVISAKHDQLAGDVTRTGTALPERALHALCRGFANASIRFAYADWGNADMRQHQDWLTRFGVDMVHVPALTPRGKNAADVRMAVDATEILFTHPEIETFVLATGDSDFCPLAVRLREYNKTVIGIGVRTAVSDRLKAVCSQYHMWSSILAATETPADRDTNRSTENPPANDRQSITPSSPPSCPTSDPATSEGAVWSPGVRVLVDVLKASSGPVVASELKSRMLRIDPYFRESTYGCRAFREFLTQHRYLLDIRDAHKGGDLTVALLDSPHG